MISALGNGRMKMANFNFPYFVMSNFRIRYAHSKCLFFGIHYSIVIFSEERKVVYQCSTNILELHFCFLKLFLLNKRYKHLESTIEIIEDALNLSKVDMSCSDPRLKNDTESENSYYFPEQ